MHALRLVIRLSPALLAFALVTYSQAPKHAASDPDGRIVTSAGGPEEDEQLATGAPSLDAAWSLLTTAASQAKRPQTRVQALAALGTMGLNPRAARLIRDAMEDPDVDVRTAAILAAEATHNRTLIAPIRDRLKDPEPQVVFAAASTLWKLHDRSGKAILMAVADGERSATPTLMHGASQDMNRELHNPSGLARIGVTEGASMLLGPFGFGLTAIEYMRRNGATTARAAAIDLLGQENSHDVRAELLDALTDKDPAVRAAAAKSLGQRHDATLARPIGSLFTDSKLPVRLTAAAAYINCSEPLPRGGRVHSERRAAPLTRRSSAQLSEGAGASATQ